MINKLKTVARFVTPIALHIYDKEDQASLLGLIAQVTKRGRVSKKGTLEWWSAFPELRKWVGDRKVQEVFQDAIEYQFAKYEETFDFDQMDLELDRDNMLATARDMGTAMGRGFAIGKVMLAYRLLTDPTTLSYDGQNFYDTEHEHPNGDVYSNLVEIGTDVDNRDTAAEPTVQEFRRELKVVMSRLLGNSLVQNSLIRTNDVKKSLVVTTRSFNTWSAANDLLEEEEIDGMPNRFRGKFELLQDHAPRAGMENSYDVTRAIPGGPRPVIFIVGKEPSKVDFDESGKFNKSRIPFGMDGTYAVTGGFPQTTVRVA